MRIGLNRRQSLSTAATPGLVTVIVPCFNYGRFLPETLASVLRQSYEYWECLVVDDGSTDDTREVVTRYAGSDRRFRYLYQSHRGVSAARNLAIRASRGEYLQFLDADDLIEPHKLECQVRYLVQHPDVGIVYSPARYFRTDAKQGRRYSRVEPDTPWMPETSGRGAAVISVLANVNVMTVNCPLVTREVVVRAGLFAEGLRMLEDWDYWIRCAMTGARFQYLDTEGTYALVRQHPLSAMNDHPRMAAALPRIYRRGVRFAPNSDTRALFEARVVASTRHLAIQQVQDGRPFRGALNALRLGFFHGECRFALKYLICLSMVPIAGKDRFTSLLFDVSFPKAIRAYFLR
jgi:hypothetical protein